MAGYCPPMRSPVVEDRSKNKDCLVPSGFLMRLQSLRTDLEAYVSAW